MKINMFLQKIFYLIMKENDRSVPKNTATTIANLFLSYIMFFVSFTNRNNMCIL